MVIHQSSLKTSSLTKLYPRLCCPRRNLLEHFSRWLRRPNHTSHSPLLHLSLTKAVLDKKNITSEAWHSKLAPNADNNSCPQSAWTVQHSFLQKFLVISIFISQLHTLYFLPFFTFYPLKAVIQTAQRSYS